jgi:hypothetical protein
MIIPLPKIYRQHSTLKIEPHPTFFFSVHYKTPINIWSYRMESINLVRMRTEKLQKMQQLLVKIQFITKNPGIEKVLQAEFF